MPGRTHWLLFAPVVLNAATSLLALRADGQGRQVPPAATKFVRVPHGKFWMGGGGGNAGLTRVEIENDFEMGAYAVTQGQWEAVMGANPSWYSRQGAGKDKVKDVGDDDLKLFPVERVSFVAVQEFLKKLNEREKGKGWLYRLPSEAEWEYACRGGATTKEQCAFDFYLAKPSKDLSSQQANFHGSFPAGAAAKGPYLARPTKVGSYAPNGLGLYDMHGNVWQWCQDSFEGGPERVIRGGSWYDYGKFCRAAVRGKNIVTGQSPYIGFRLVRVADAGK